MRYVEGLILTPKGFQRGYVGFEDGHIVEVKRGRPKESLAKGIVVPALRNAHTHLGDAVIRIELRGTIEELVAPPHGLKHKLLAEAKDDDVVEAVRETLRVMLHTGTASFSDFRETGLRGLRLLCRALLGFPLSPQILGRPAQMRYDRNEVDALLRVGDGIGLSSYSDWEPSEIEKIAKHARSKGGCFALHCSERVREDVDKVLDLKPDFLVHMLQATDGDLERCTDADVPVVVCPRSNAFYGLAPNIPHLLEKGVEVRLGTDNAMLNSPSMLREMEFAYRIGRLKGEVTPDQVLRMAIGGAKRNNGNTNSGLQTGGRADILVIEARLEGSPYGAIMRSVESDIALVSIGERTWLRKGEGLEELAVEGRRRGRGLGKRRGRRPS